MPVTRYDAVLLLGFGGPGTPQEIKPFLERALDGRRIPSARYEEVVAHYVQIGGKSPYNDLTRRQADAVAESLRERGIEVPVFVAYRNAEPFVHDVLERLAKGHARSVFGIVLSPHQSAASWDKYVRVAEDARAQIGADAPRIDYIDPYFDHPLFIRAHAERIDDARVRLGRGDFDGLELIFSAHSIPQSASGADTYVRQLRRSAELIAQGAGAKHWEIAYQSRSGSPNEPWLGPDIRDALRALPGRGIREAIVAPVGFLCDHVEVLYDLDIDAKNVAHSAGVRVERATALNDHPMFIRMLSELAAAPPQPARRLGEA